MALRYVVIDDSLFIRELIKTTVSSYGLRFVGESDNVEDALKLIENYRPHVIIVDLVLPEKNGIELIKEIRVRYPEMAIIACSTLIDLDIQKMAINAGCNYFLKKPFNKETVGDAITSVISKN